MIIASINLRFLNVIYIQFIIINMKQDFLKEKELKIIEKIGEGAFG